MNSRSLHQSVFQQQGREPEMAVERRRSPASLPPILIDAPDAGNGREVVVTVVEGRARRRAMFEIERTGLAVASSSVDCLVDDLRRLHPAAVLFDAKLRGADVIDLCASLRAEHAHEQLPILVIGCSETLAQRALAAGATDVVRRPLDWRIVACRTVQLAEGFRSRRRLAQVSSQLEALTKIQDQDSSRLQRLETLDGLTGLPGRKVFDRVLEQGLAAASRLGQGIAVLYLDIDRFSEINQSLGRRVGDRVLQETARRLGDCLRSAATGSRQRPGIMSTTLARMSGDEFTILIGSVAGETEVSKVAERLLSSVSEVIVIDAIDAIEIYLSASIGIALAPMDSLEQPRLLQHAETACCEAKRRGGSQHRYFSTELNQAAESKRRLIGHLHSAFDDGLLAIHYQPIVDVRSRRIVAAEALLRWTDPDLGSIPPAEFVPLAEEAGLMVPIGTWVLNTACRQLKCWIGEGLPPIRIAVNISFSQLRRGNLHAIVRAALDTSGLKPSLLELELSERGVLRDDPEVLEQLIELEQMGVRLSVDDFGTGESAIAYLRQFPANVLKVDRSYIAGSLENDDDAVITAAMIAMAHKLRLSVVAEGVEIDSQLQLLAEWGCDEFQGYLFSRALEPPDFSRVLAEHGGSTVN